MVLLRALLCFVRREVCEVCVVRGATKVCVGGSSVCVEILGDPKKMGAQTSSETRGNAD